MAEDGSVGAAGAEQAAAAYPFPPGSVFTDGHPLPRLVVFDLDYTLWPFWVDTHVTPPVRLAAAAAAAAASPGSFTPASVVDGDGETFAFYADVPRVLQALPAAGVRMGVASRTSAPALARDVLALLRVPAGQTAARRALDVFAAGLEIYPGSKLRHMEALHARTGVPYASVLFFDDESRNRNVETLGVTMYLVRDGVTWAAVERGVRAWRRRHGHAGGDGGGRRGAKKANRNSWQADEEDYEYEE